MAPLPGVLLALFLADTEEDNKALSVNEALRFGACLGVRLHSADPSLAMAIADAVAAGMRDKWQQIQDGVI